MTLGFGDGVPTITNDRAVLDGETGDVTFLDTLRLTASNQLLLGYAVAQNGALLQILGDAYVNGASTVTGALSSGPHYFTPGASLNPASNGQLVLEFTANGVVTLKGRGSDGVVRSGTITLTP